MVCPHPWTSLVLLPSSQTPGSGCCPRWDTRSCTGLNVPHLPIHVKQINPFLSFYCSGLEVVETQSTGCALPRVLLLTFSAPMRAEGTSDICGDVYSRAFQSFVIMTPNVNVSVLSCNTGLLVLPGHCSWLVLVSVSGEMALTPHKLFLSKLTQRVVVGYMSLISSLHQPLPDTCQIFPWEVEMEGGMRWWGLHTFQ